jgi:uncharacterized protein YndB with AHSA1/START domain
MTDEIDSVGREVAEGAGETRTVTIIRTYPTGIEDLWDACTNPERLPRWFLPVTGDLRVGGRYQLAGNAGGTIERCEPPRSFSATWEFGNSVNWITVRLVTESEDRTRLELEHTVPVDDHWDQFGPGAVGVGWDLALLGLGQHLASGSAVDPSEAAAWVASEDGKAFIRHSSGRWGQANVAGGAEAAAARAQAEQTTTAYTGDGQSGSS